MHEGNVIFDIFHIACRLFVVKIAALNDFVKNETKGEKRKESKGFEFQSMQDYYLRI